MVTGNSQNLAIQNYRTHVGERRLARFEVLGREADRDLIRTLSPRLAEEGPEVSWLRAVINQPMSGNRCATSPTCYCMITVRFRGLCRDVW